MNDQKFPNMELLNLQKNFESGLITEEDMTPIQREQLLNLYKSQIRGLDDETYGSYQKFEQINLWSIVDFWLKMC